MPKTRKNTKDLVDVSIANIPPPFCRQGNKYPIRREIISLIPEHTTYVEPFAGSAAIFYNKPPAEISVLNDLDEHTYNQHRFLRDAPVNPTAYPKGLDNLDAIKRFYKKHAKTRANRLIYEKIEACNGFSGSPVRASYGIYRKADPTKILKHLEFYQSRLSGMNGAIVTPELIGDRVVNKSSTRKKRVKILNQDYAKVVAKYDGPTTFFFFDPPYEKTRSVYGYGEHRDFDFDRLLEVLRTVRGRFLMTINDSPHIRELFAEFTVKPIKVYDRWSRKNKRAGKRKELLIMNYYSNMHS